LSFDNGHDYSGNTNLEIISENYRFNDWMFRQINKGLRETNGNVLEVGSGLGTFSDKIIQCKSPESKIILTDISDKYLRRLRQKYSSHKNVTVCRLDLDRGEDYGKIGYGMFSFIIALNVLEHIKDDQFALQELYGMLQKDGMLVILVPCHKFLYNVIDVNVGHYRRYAKKELLKKINMTHFYVERISYFNTLGIAGWYINGNLWREPRINRVASKWFDRLVPVLEYLDRITFNITGLSLICYLKK
jgi:ubiquinone/menaquinone biosynthesis C-methylase UbiE